MNTQELKLFVSYLEKLLSAEAFEDEKARIRILEEILHFKKQLILANHCQ